MAQSITVNGNTYNDSPYDASSNPNGLANGGWRVNSKFITMLLDTLADATANMRTTSATLLTIGTGPTDPLTLAQDIPFAVGDFVLISDTAAPTTNWMVGQITNRTNDDITVNVTKVAGSGTLSAWTVQLSAVPGEVGDTGPAGVDGTNYWNTPTSVTNASSPYNAGDKDLLLCDFTSGAIDINLPASGRVAFKFATAPNSTNLLRVIPPSGDSIFNQTANDAVTFTKRLSSLALVRSGTNWS